MQNNNIHFKFMRPILSRTSSLLARPVPPAWLKKLCLVSDKWVDQYMIRMRDPRSFEEKPFDPKIMEACQIHEAILNRLCLNEPTKRYVMVGRAFAFPDSDDNPVVRSHAVPANLWWDPSSPAQKLLVQLSPYYPPALWLPIKPTTEAIARLFSECLLTESAVADDAAVLYDKLQTSLQTELGADYSKLDPVLLYHRILDHVRQTDPADIKTDFPLSRRYLYGHVPDTETVETSFLRNPFVSCWPILLGDRNDHQADGGAKVSVFRTLHSSSLVGIETREDFAVMLDADADGDAAGAARRGPRDAVGGGELSKSDRELERYCETRLPAFMLVNHAPLRRMAGGGAIIQRYNALVGSSFAEDTPVDVVACSIPALPQDASSVGNMLRGMLESSEKLEVAVSELTRAVHGGDTSSGTLQAEQRLLSDYRHTLSAAATYAMHLSVLRDPHGEFDTLVRPLARHPRAMLRLAAAKAAAELGVRDIVEDIAKNDPTTRNREACANVLDEWPEDADQLGSGVHGFQWGKGSENVDPIPEPTEPIDIGNQSILEPAPTRAT